MQDYGDRRMTSYYTELDDARGADDEAGRDLYFLEADRSRRTKSAKVTTKSRGSKVLVNCLCCKVEFSARVADRARGWARFCSKSCKALKQEQRTGQMARYLSRR